MAEKLQSFSRIINWHLVAQGASPSFKFFHEFLVLNNVLNMAPPLNLLIRALVAFEDVIIRQVCDLHIIPAIHSRLTSNFNPQILRSPGFHRGVGRIHRYVDEKRNGPMPHEPLRQGQATGTLKSNGLAGRESFEERVADVVGL